MKKPYWYLVLSLLVVVLLIALAPMGFGFSTYDYGLKCTRCLREYHIVEKRFLGFTYSKKQTLVFAGYDLKDITGSQCQHIYRTNGYGRQIGVIEEDGETAEGELFRMRFQARNDAFQDYQRFPDKDLMRETLIFIDSCLPPDATVEHRREYRKQAYLMILSDSLEKGQSEQDWKTALDSVKNQMATDAANLK